MQSANPFRFMSRILLFGLVAVLFGTPHEAFALVIGGAHFDETTCSAETPELMEHHALIEQARKDIHSRNADQGFHFEYFLCRLEKQCLHGKDNTYFVTKKPDIENGTADPEPTLRQKALAKGTLQELVILVEDKTECMKVKDDAQNRRTMQKLIDHLNNRELNPADAEVGSGLSRPGEADLSVGAARTQEHPETQITNQVKNLNGLKLF